MELTAALHMITSGFEGIQRSVTKMFESFKQTMNTIVPKLNEQERDKFNNAFSNYTKFLMNTQEFISCTSTGIRYAETLEHLCEAVPQDLLKTLIDDVQSLLKDFQSLEWLIHAKLAEDKTVGYFKDIMIGVCIAGVAFALIGTGVGAVLGLSAAALGKIAGIGVVASVVGASGAAIAHAAMKCTDIGKILETLEKIKKCLINIAQEQASVNGRNTGINKLKSHSAEQQKKIVNEQRKEFQVILEKTQKEVNRGFKILK